MSNCVVTSTSTFLPPLRSAKCRIASKNELLRDEKSDFITALPRMIDKLCIDESAKKNVADKSIQEEITKRATPLYDVAGISSEELQTFLRRITENTQQPFSFLANISKEFADDTRSTVNAKKPTEIDMQLAAAAKRIESNKVLLEEAKSHVEDIRLRAEQELHSTVVGSAS